MTDIQRNRDILMINDIFIEIRYRYVVYYSQDMRWQRELGDFSLFSVNSDECVFPFFFCIFLFFSSFFVRDTIAYNTEEIQFLTFMKKDKISCRFRFTMSRSSFLFFRNSVSSRVAGFNLMYFDLTSSIPNCNRAASQS